MKLKWLTSSNSVPPSLTKILSLDSVPVSVEAVIYMRVRDATAAETNVEDYRCPERTLSWLNPCDCGV